MFFSRKDGLSTRFPEPFYPILFPIKESFQKAISVHLLGDHATNDDRIDKDTGYFLDRLKEHDSDFLVLCATLQENCVIHISHNSSERLFLLFP